NDDPVPAQLAKIESVERLAHLEHYVVGYVDNVVDRSHPGRLQPRLHPVRRWSHPNALHNSGDVARTKVFVFDRYRASGRGRGGGGLGIDAFRFTDSR